MQHLVSRLSGIVKVGIVYSVVCVANLAELEQE